MTDFPGVPPLPLFKHTYGFDSAYPIARSAGSVGAATNLTWVANLAIYVPVLVPWAYPVKRVFWINGSTITSSNADFGIYTVDGTRIYSTGSTALSGTSAAQYVTPSTSFVLSPGAYYFAYACDNTTARTLGAAGTAGADALRLTGCYQQASALPLPATATFASMANALYPFCGVTRTASGF